MAGADEWMRARLEEQGRAFERVVDVTSSRTELPPGLDLVWCRDVLHRLGDGEIERLLARIRHALAPGGLVCVRTAVARGAPRFERSDERLEMLRRATAYEDAFAAAGFAIACGEDMPARRDQHHVVRAWILR